MSAPLFLLPLPLSLLVFASLSCCMVGLGTSGAAPTHRFRRDRSCTQVTSLLCPSCWSLCLFVSLSLCAAGLGSSGAAPTHGLTAQARPAATRGRQLRRRQRREAPARAAPERGECSRTPVRGMAGRTPRSWGFPALVVLQYCSGPYAWWCMGRRKWHVKPIPSTAFLPSPCAVRRRGRAGRRGGTAGTLSRRAHTTRGRTRATTGRGGQQRTGVESRMCLQSRPSNRHPNH